MRLKVTRIMTYFFVPVALILSALLYPLLYAYSNHPEHVNLVFQYNLFVLCFSIAGVIIMACLYLFLTRKMFVEQKDLFFKFFLGTTIIAAGFFLFFALQYISSTFKDSGEGYGRLFFATTFPPASALLSLIYWFFVYERIKVFSRQHHKKPK
jgi:hypothetical protein